MSRENSDEQFVFEPKDKRVLIGRLNDCDIKLDDTNLSRYQTEVIYKNKWTLNDGCAGKRSTNGTWLFVDKPFILQNDTVFKAGKTLFKTRIVD
jgi:hypothetical protein